MKLQDEKVAILIPIWGFSKSGGIKVLSNFINRWTDSGINTKVVCYYKSDEPYYPIKADIVYVDNNGKKVNREEAERNQSIHKYLKSIYDTYHGLYIAMDNLSHEYNVAIANYDLTAYSVAKSTIKNKFYYIQAYEAWHNEKKLSGKIRNYLSKKTYTLDLNRIVNANIYKNYKEIKSEHVVPPGIDLSIYHRKEGVWDGRRPFRVGCIGRAQAWKGSDDVALAVEMLQSRLNNIEFDVAFNPVNHGDFKLLHPDGDSKLSDFYRYIDVMVAPGTIQLGAVHYPVIEAMACNTPVITTGYYPANSNNAYIVPVSDPKAIADTIEHIMENYEEAMAKAEIAYSDISEFEWDKVSQKMLDIIAQTI